MVAVAIMDTTPLGLENESESVPRVARAGQPWALGRDPVGVKTELEWNVRRGVFRRVMQPKDRVPLSQRDCVTQPRVATKELPWVNNPRNIQPQRGCVIAGYGSIPHIMLIPFLIVLFQ